jgi:hypothetical protein
MLCQLEGRFAGVGLNHVVAPLLALLTQRPAHQALVVNDHDFLGGHRCLIYYEMEADCFVGFGGGVKVWDLGMGLRGQDALATAGKMPALQM